jgi:hypothetical protein
LARIQSNNLKNQTLKIAYILLAGTGVFFIYNLYILLAVFIAHLLLWFGLKNGISKLRFLLKVKWFILLILIFNALTTSAGDVTLIKISSFKLGVEWEGLLNGTLQSLKLMTMLLITNLVRNTMSSDDFVIGLRSLGLNKTTSETVHQIFSVVGEGKKQKKPGEGKGKGTGGGKGKEKDEANVTARQVLGGKIGNIPNKIRKRLEQGQEQFGSSEGAVVGATSLAVTLVRMVKIAPGLPLAPGHKNILLVPLFIYAARKSKSGFAGTSVGLISGILHFAMGFGKYGPLGILQFVLFGFVIDLILKLAPNKNSLLLYTIAGGVAGLMRFSSELLLALIFGLPESFFLLYIPIVVSQVLFGAGSGIIAVALLKEKKLKENNTNE